MYVPQVPLLSLFIVVSTYRLSHFWAQASGGGEALQPPRCHGTATAVTRFVAFSDTAQGEQFSGPPSTPLTRWCVGMV